MVASSKWRANFVFEGPDFVGVVVSLRGDLFMESVLRLPSGMLCSVATHQPWFEIKLISACGSMVMSPFY